MHRENKRLVADFEFNYFYHPNTSSNEIPSSISSSIFIDVNIDSCDINTTIPECIGVIGLNRPDDEIVAIAEEWKRNLAAMDRVHYYLEEGLKMEAYQLLANINTNMGDRRVIPYYIQQEDFEIVDSLLASLPDQRQEMRDYRDFFQIIRALRFNNRSYFELTASEEETIREIASHATKTAFYARGLLFMLYGEIYPVILDMEEEDVFVTSFKMEGQKKPENAVRVYPNPAQEVINLQYKPLKKQVHFILLDSNGKIVLTKELAKNSSFDNISLKDLPNGLYYYQLEKQEGKLMILK